MTPICPRLAVQASTCRVKSRQAGGISHRRCAAAAGPSYQPASGRRDGTSPRATRQSAGISLCRPFWRGSFWCEGAADGSSDCRDKQSVQITGRPCRSFRSRFAAGLMHPPSEQIHPVAALRPGRHAQGPSQSHHAQKIARRRREVARSLQRWSAGGFPPTVSR
jgi:hypothetical protein